MKKIADSIRLEEDYQGQFATNVDEYVFNTYIQKVPFESIDYLEEDLPYIEYDNLKLVKFDEPFKVFFDNDRQVDTYEAVIFDTITNNFEYYEDAYLAEQEILEQAKDDLAQQQAEMFL